MFSGDKINENIYYKNHNAAVEIVLSLVYFRFVSRVVVIET